MRRSLLFPSTGEFFISFYISICDHNQSTKETKDTSPYSRMWLSDHCDLSLIFIRAAVGRLDCYFAWHERRAGGKVQPRLIRAGAALWLTFYTLVSRARRIKAAIYIMWDFVSANNKRVHIDRRGRGCAGGWRRPWAIDFPMTYKFDYRADTDVNMSKRRSLKTHTKEREKWK